MKNNKLVDYFYDYYLTPGTTRDNYLFTNLTSEDMCKAVSALKEHSNDVNCCIIRIDKVVNDAFNSVITNCKNDIQKKIFARDLFSCLFMQELKKKETHNDDEIFKLVSAFKEGDFEKVKSLINFAPFPYDITKEVRKNNKIELNVFLECEISTFLQGAINNYLSSRESYSVKVYTNNDDICTRYDHTGCLIQSPHDFMKIDVRKYQEVLNEK